MLLRMCVDMRMDMCIDMCVDMCIDVCIDMCIDMRHRHVHRNVCADVCDQRCGQALVLVPLNSNPLPQLFINVYTDTCREKCVCVGVDTRVRGYVYGHVFSVF